MVRLGGCRYTVAMDAVAEVGRQITDVLAAASQPTVVDLREAVDAPRP